MESGKWKVEIAARTIAVLTVCWPLAAAAQTPEQPRVSVSASVGVADLRGGGIVAANKEPALTGRVSIRLSRWISLDAEGSVTGETTSRDYNRHTDWQWREVRREITAAAYARLHAWSDGWASVEPVAGVGFLNAPVQGWQRHYNPLISQYSEWRRGEPGQYGYDGFYAPYDLWVVGLGVDVALGSRRLAVVPEVRVMIPFTSAGGTFDSGVQTRAALGLRAGF